jgi:hypothetical protein
MWKVVFAVLALSMATGCAGISMNEAVQSARSDCAAVYGQVTGQCVMGRAQYLLDRDAANRAATWQAIGAGLQGMGNALAQSRQQTINVQTDCTSNRIDYVYTSCR